MSSSDSESEKKTESSDWDDWVEDETEHQATKCLFCDLTHPSPFFILEHCKTTHNFDILKLKKDWKLDYYKTIKLINFIRLSVAQQKFSQLQFQDMTSVMFEKSAIDWDNEMYLKPVIEDDPLLTIDISERNMKLNHLGTQSSTLRTEHVQQNNQSLVCDRRDDECDDEEWSSDDEFVKSELNSTMTCVNVNNINTSGHLNSTSQQNQTLSIFTNENYNLKDVPSLPLDQLSKEQLLQRLIIAEKRAMESERRLKQTEFHLQKLHTFVTHTFLDETSDVKRTEFDNSQNNEADYFATYTNFHIHEEMLKDKVRTESYRDFIYQNADYFKGKIVMDVGCGTGILSMFAARAGAKHVVAVDKADIIRKAKYFAEENKLNDKITFIHSKVEEIEQLKYVGGDDKVDVIISEWMGYCLLFESMLSSIIESRDKFLRSGGKVFPNQCSLHMAAIEDRDYRKEKIEFWNDVYGFNMAHMNETVLMEPVVAVVNPEQIVSDVISFKEFDINTVQLNDVNFTSMFELTMQKDDRVDGFVIWFDVHFDDPCLLHPLSFSTGPFSLPTHWRQTSFYLNEFIPVSKGQKISGNITMKKGRTFARDLDVIIEYQVEQQDKKKQYFHLE